MRQVTQWLKSLHLEKYVQAIFENEYESMELIRGLSKPQIEDLITCINCTESEAAKIRRSLSEPNNSDLEDNFKELIEHLISSMEALQAECTTLERKAEDAAARKKYAEAAKFDDQCNSKKDEIKKLEIQQAKYGEKLGAFLDSLNKECTSLEEKCDAAAKMKKYLEAANLTSQIEAKRHEYDTLKKLYNMITYADNEVNEHEAGTVDDSGDPYHSGDPSPVANAEQEYNLQDVNSGTIDNSADTFSVNPYIGLLNVEGNAVDDANIAAKIAASAASAALTEATKAEAAALKCARFAKAAYMKKSNMPQKELSVSIMPKSWKPHGNDKKLDLSHQFKKADGKISVSLAKDKIKNGAIMPPSMFYVFSSTLGTYHKFEIKFKHNAITPKSIGEKKKVPEQKPIITGFDLKYMKNSWKPPPSEAHLDFTSRFEFSVSKAQAAANNSLVAPKEGFFYVFSNRVQTYHKFILQFKKEPLLCPQGHQLTPTEVPPGENRYECDLCHQRNLATGDRIYTCQTCRNWDACEKCYNNPYTLNLDDLMEDDKDMIENLSLKGDTVPEIAKKAQMSRYTGSNISR